MVILKCYAQKQRIRSVAHSSQITSFYYLKGYFSLPSKAIFDEMTGASDCKIEAPV
jgi:hypothetical protein